MQRNRWNLVEGTLFALLALGTVQPVNAQLGGVVRPHVTRPDGPVWQIIRKDCTDCHGIDDYAYYALDRDGWRKLIVSKHKDEGVTLSDADMNTLLDWVVSQFGPTSKPFPRTYRPATITTFLTDAEANDLIDRACTNCHPRDRIDNSRKAEGGWRVTVLSMRERGAQISDDELEHLVEWLGRVLGTNRDK